MTIPCHICRTDIEAESAMRLEESSQTVCESCYYTVTGVPLAELNFRDLVISACGDYNDELTFIVNSAQEVRDLIGPYHAATDSIAVLVLSAMRCAGTTRALMHIARRGYYE